VLEGDLGAGVRLRADAGTTHPEWEMTTTTDSFTRTMSGVPVYNNVHVINDTGTRISIGRLFARPVDFTPSCDLLLAPKDQASTQLQVKVTDTTTNIPQTYPGLAAIVNTTPLRDGQKYAHVVIGSHLISGTVLATADKAGTALPVRTLIDWTEQFASTATQASCGALEPLPAPDKPADTTGRKSLTPAFGDQQAAKAAGHK